MKIIRGTRFKKEFKRLPEHVRTRATKQLALLLENPHHPSLQTKKMEGHRGIREGRISRGYRFTFEMKKEALVLRRIGSHEILKNP